MILERTKAATIYIYVVVILTNFYFQLGIIHRPKYA